jgi:hypothetical protein
MILLRKLFQKVLDVLILDLGDKRLKALPEYESVLAEENPLCFMVEISVDEKE